MQTPVSLDKLLVGPMNPAIIEEADHAGERREVLSFHYGEGGLKLVSLVRDLTLDRRHLFRSISTPVDVYHMRMSIAEADHVGAAREILRIQRGDHARLEIVPTVEGLMVGGIALQVGVAVPIETQALYRVV